VTALYVVLVGVVVMMASAWVLALALCRAAQVGDEIADGWDHGLEWWKDRP
jgi:hypothetical protein